MGLRVDSQYHTAPASEGHSRAHGSRTGLAGVEGGLDHPVDDAVEQREPEATRPR